RYAERMNHEESETEDSNGWRRFSPLIGFGVGGCIIPSILFTFCLVVLRDIGGPLFWPIITLPMAGIGFLIGFGFRKKKNDQIEEKKDDRHDGRTD
ncbi:hypothetical protein QEH56_24555, partial [Pelagicoccus enzymogenes]|uniref:hypothetical protein n=1 Tax=Pelagicoccus enzymogenes TaxID=2773457 RepID=UPI00280FCCC5